MKAKIFMLILLPRPLGFPNSIAGFNTTIPRLKETEMILCHERPPLSSPYGIQCILVLECGDQSQSPFYLYNSHNR